MNNTYKIKIKSPLVRAGIEIETEVSEKYVVPALNKLMDKVREFNNSENIDFDKIKDTITRGH